MPGHPYPMGALTPRDRDVITLVLAGHTNAEIARRLNIQLQTLKNALSAIYDKLGVSSRLQLAVLLLRDGDSLAGAVVR
jgi:DNA-binding NarL/FixJ family response regulator